MIPFREKFTPSNPDNWALLYSTRLQFTGDERAVRASGAGFLEPLEVPFTTASSIIMIDVSSPQNPGTWVYGGTLVQTAATQLISQPSDPDIPYDPQPIFATLGRWKCRLDIYEAILLNDSVQDKRLTLYPPFWIKDLFVSIWEYSGPITNEIITEIEGQNAALEIMDIKLDQILGSLNP